jgi:alpha-L-fucosidase
VAGNATTITFVPRMKTRRLILPGLALLLPLVALRLAAADAVPKGAPVDTGDANAQQSLVHLEPAEQVAQRLAWWSEARFGLFIHWGLYSQWGCHYPGADGKLLDGKSEHMMRHLRLPLALYSTIARVYNPTQFNADEWVRVAKDAGMKYMVITSKHHDGFALWQSASNPYNLVQRTPFKRDAIKELADACQRGGLKFAVYYSLGRDWEDPDVPTEKKADGNRRSNDWDWPDETRKDFAKYFERKVKPQVRELLTNYGPIAIMWFDTPEKITRAQSEELMRLIHELQPNCIVNQRVGNRLGDYRVAEQEIPAAGYADAWETCMTLNGHWGYYLGDEKWKSVETVVRHLVDIASKGGNFLLNVGPTGEGIIPQPSVDRLHEVGAWLKVNGPAIYGTSASPIGRPAWGRCTQKTSGDRTTLYLHVFDWPKDGRLVVTGVKGAASGATLLATGAKLDLSAAADGFVVSVPPTAPDAISSTIAVTLSAAR